MCWQTLPTEYSYYGGHIVNRCGARCVVIQECQQLISLLKQSPIQPQTIANLRQAHCGFDGKNPKVCCPNSPPVVTPLPPTETPPTTDGKSQTPWWESHPKAHLIPADVCGIDNTQRIWGGNRTDFGQYPWAALLQYQTRKCSNEATIVSSIVG